MAETQFSRIWNEVTKGTDPTDFYDNEMMQGTPAEGLKGSLAILAKATYPLISDKEAVDLAEGMFFFMMRAVERRTLFPQRTIKGGTK